MPLLGALSSCIISIDFTLLKDHSQLCLVTTNTNASTVNVPKL